MWMKIQASQARKPAKLEPADVGDRAPAADHGELPLVPVAERPARPPAQVVAGWSRAAYSPIWIATGATPGSGLPSWWSKRGGVAQDEDLGMARDGAVGLHQHPARPVQRDAERS